MTTQNHTIDWETQLPAHREWMVALARHRVRDPHAAEDVVQEVVLSVVRQNPLLADPTKIRAWLYQAVVRRTADYLRNCYRRDRVQGELLHCLPEQDDGDGLDWVLASEKRVQLKAAIGGLSDEDREILLLKFTQNWTYKQLSEKFGIAERAVEYRLVCAKRQMRAELQRLHGDDDE